MAVLNVDDAVPAPPLMETERQPAPVGRPRGVLHLVAVTERLDGGIGRADLHIGQMRDPREMLHDLLALGALHPLGGHVLQPASAAPGDAIADGLDPVRPRAEDLLQACLAETPPRLAQAHAGTVAGGGVVAEDDEAVGARHSLPSEGQIVDRDLKDVVALWPLSLLVLHDRGS